MRKKERSIIQHNEHSPSEKTHVTNSSESLENENRIANVRGSMPHPSVSPSG